MTYLKLEKKIKDQFNIFVKLKGSKEVFNLLKKKKKRYLTFSIQYDKEFFKFKLCTQGGRRVVLPHMTVFDNSSSLKIHLFGHKHKYESLRHIQKYEKEKIEIIYLFEIIK